MRAMPHVSVFIKVKRSRGSRADPQIMCLEPARSRLLGCEFLLLPSLDVGHPRPRCLCSLSSWPTRDGTGTQVMMHRFNRSVHGMCSRNNDCWDTEQPGCKRAAECQACSRLPASPREASTCPHSSSTHLSRCTQCVFCPSTQVSPG